MTDRHFRVLLGLVLLALLYLDAFTGIGVLAAYLMFEGVTNWRLPLLTRRLLPGSAGDACSLQPVEASTPARLPFEAERALRLSLALILWLAVYLYPGQLWWMAWFVAFAVLGAGLSGVCPMLTGLRLLGFR